jgi:hypothetical protein
MERRDNARRADTMRRVAERLAQSRDGLIPEDLSAAGVVVAAGAARIFKRLMWRGLARGSDGRCLATAALLRAAPLQRVAPDG